MSALDDFIEEARRASVAAYCGTLGVAVNVVLGYILSVQVFGAYWAKI